jgi:hypothetical protein
MKKSLAIIALLFIAFPAWGQDEAPDGPSSGGGSGAGQAQVFTRIDSIDPMAQVKAFLAKAKITLTGDQEKALRPAVEAALKQAQEATERFNVQPPGGRGQRGLRREGAGRSAGGSPLLLELRRINDDLIMKINAALKPDQQAELKKFQSDEIKRAGGYPALKLIMLEAGAPFTPEQELQVQALYADNAQQRFRLATEAQGRPDPAKVEELEKSTMVKIARLLTPAQRKALLDSRAKPAQQ